MSHIPRKRATLPILGALLIGALFAAQSVSANIIRPNGATPIQASLVIAYNNCAASSPAGEVHNSNNLFGAACAFPSAGGTAAKSSTHLTSGDPVLNGAVANFKGNIKLVAKITVQEDVLFPSLAQGGCGPAPDCGNFVQDVRCEVAYASGSGSGVCSDPNGTNTSANPDYVGDLNTVALIRITDQANSGNAATCTGPTPTCPDDATVQTLPFAVPSDCVATPAANIGGFCQPRYASAHSFCLCVANGHRSNIEIGQPFVNDGGDDGVVTTGVTDTDNAQTYARMGIFLP